MKLLFGPLLVIGMHFVSYIEISSGMNSNFKKTKTLRLFGKSLEVSEDPTVSSGTKPRRKGFKSLRLAENGELKIFNEITRCFEEEPLPTPISNKRRAIDKDRPSFQVHVPNFHNNNELHGIPTCRPSMQQNNPNRMNNQPPLEISAIPVYRPIFQQNDPYIHHNNGHPIVPVSYAQTPISGHPNSYDNHPHFEPKDLRGNEAYQLFQKHYTKHPLPPKSAQNAAYDFYQEHYNKYPQPPTFKDHPGTSGSISGEH